MRGYDDEAIIAKVEETLAAEPALSRRAAIIKVAGEGSLRRIEMKMRRRLEVTAGEIRIPGTGWEGDPLAARLATGETALRAVTGEKTVWSGFSSRDLPFRRKIRDRVPSVETLSLIGVPLTVASFLVMTLSLMAMWGSLFVRKGFGIKPWPALETTFMVSFWMGILGMCVGFVTASYLRFKSERVESEVRNELRRYLVTDRAAYVLEPTEDGVRWTRSGLGWVVGGEKHEDDVRVVGSAAQVTLADVVDAPGLLAVLGNLRQSIPAATSP